MTLQTAEECCSYEQTAARIRGYCDLTVNQIVWVETQLKSWEAAVRLDERDMVISDRYGKWRDGISLDERRKTLEECYIATGWKPAPSETVNTTFDQYTVGTPFEETDQ